MCRSLFAAALALLPLILKQSPARAQACCAGSAAVTPARLALHEDALIGTTVRVAGILGSYAPDGSYTKAPSHTSEVDLEEDLIGAVRVTKRGQLALLVPLVETYRAAPGEGGATGGGIGDINIGARYDFILAGAWRYVPGVAVLAGLTVPTGRTVASAKQPLAVDATGIGAFQGNIGVALEQTWGPWLVSVTGLLAKRAAYSTQGVDELLATQLTGLAAVAYTFRSEAAVGVVAGYAAEGNATINGVTDPNSHKRAVTMSVVGLQPLTDALRLQGSIFITPPLSELGANQPATGGLTLTLLWGFS
jgi:hypothetical protein